MTKGTVLLSVSFSCVGYLGYEKLVSKNEHPTLFLQHEVALQQTDEGMATCECLGAQGICIHS